MTSHNDADTLKTKKSLLSDDFGFLIYTSKPSIIRQALITKLVIIYPETINGIMAELSSNVYFSNLVAGLRI